MSRRRPWLVFVAALLVLVAVMVGVTARMVALEHERAAAEQRSAHEEQVRLALWRLDTEIAPLLSQELAAVATLARNSDSALHVPLPPEVRARFVLPSDGALRVSAADDEVSAALERVVAGADLWALAPAPTEGARQLDNPTASTDQVQQALDRPRPSGSYFGSAQQAYRNVTELQNRMQAIDDNVAAYQSSLEISSLGLDAEPDGAAFEARAGGPARPTWIGGELVLIRQLVVDDRRQLHGSWIDWPRLRARLQGEIDELLPQAELVPAVEAGDDVQHLLATLPVRLQPGPPTTPISEAGGLLAPSLALGWLGTLVAALAVFAVLRSTLALSERRAAFVSAVTHELRTPLTTFRMYAEMLEEGMVDEAKRGHYLTTLRREADRLGDLVENVLAYARIESDRAPLSPQTLTVEALLERVRERLEERCRVAALPLDVELPPGLATAELRVDPSAAEQILFNLVDNAAKYAPSRQGPGLELRVASGPHGLVELSVRDHGPGIEPSEREAIFEPFAKAKAHASGSMPGVGLGLALSRRLAQQLGGGLRVELAEPGARFVLSIPRARDSQRE